MQTKRSARLRRFLLGRRQNQRHAADHPDSRRNTDDARDFDARAGLVFERGSVGSALWVGSFAYVELVVIALRGEGAREITASNGARDDRSADHDPTDGRLVTGRWFGLGRLRLDGLRCWAGLFWIRLGQLYFD